MMRLLLAPFDDYLAGLSACLQRKRGAVLALIVVAFVATWFVYVPIHELLHAFGCMAAGGTVTRLEIDAIYGAAWLQRLFPYVAVGSEYAGQLTGFDTHGSDVIYLITDFTPFLLTIFLGVPLLRWSGYSARHWYSRGLGFGVSLPIAFAPFISLTGDYYEMGSILVSRFAATWLGRGTALNWRGDDLFKILHLARTQFTGADVVGVSVSFVVGMGLAWLTYAVGSLIGDAISARPRRHHAVARGDAARRSGRDHTSTR